MLILQNERQLKQYELWLCEAYTKTLKKITGITINPNSTIDPFASEYYGKNSVKIDSNSYNSLLELTSYFWGSKAGRGTLLQKMIKFLSGDNAEQEIYLSKFLDKLVGSSNTLNGRVSDKFKQKFDLINIENSKLVILEIKNRVDSGGTSARREGLKKFFAMSNNVENNTIALTDIKSGKEYRLIELLKELGITKVEMLMGFLYNRNGSGATREDDIREGFYGESKSLITQYGDEHLGIKYDTNKLRIDFCKDDMDFVIETVYGSDSTKRFTENRLTLDNVLQTVFSKSWDDIWLALDTGIRQRSILLDYKKNYITEIQRLYNESEEFKKELNRFKSNSNNLTLLRTIVDKTQTNIAKDVPKLSDQNVADCLYLCTRFIK